jgi:hypothetical protein
MIYLKGMRLSKLVELQLDWIYRDNRLTNAQTCDKMNTHEEKLPH